mgnify:CR=1 FL=1|tara:strand:+ start:4292 stop:5215 length:924 start_codon:yes stop_codon:yes gene_type:complete
MKFHFLKLSFVAAYLCLSSIAQASSSFKVTSYNIRNFSAVEGVPSDYRPIDGATNPIALDQVLTSFKSDIMAFQEIINGELFGSIIKETLPRHQLILTECGGTADQKVGIAFDRTKFDLINSVEDWRVSLSNRCNYGLRPALVVILKHKKTRKQIAVIAVHLKAGSGERNRNTRREQHEILSVVINELREKSIKDVVVLGDFNTTSYFEQTPGAAQFDDFLKDNDLRNTSSSLSCTSYWQGDRGDGNMAPSHLDHILHNGRLRFIGARVGAHCAQTSCQPTPEADLGDTFKGVSDHCPVQVEFRYSR